MAQKKSTNLTTTLTCCAILLLFITSCAPARKLGQPSTLEYTTPSVPVEDPFKEAREQQAQYIESDNNNFLADIKESCMLVITNGTEPEIPDRYHASWEKSYVRRLAYLNTSNDQIYYDYFNHKYWLFCQLPRPEVRN